MCAGKLRGNQVRWGRRGTGKLRGMMGKEGYGKVEGNIGDRGVRGS